MVVKDEVHAGDRAHAWSDIGGGLGLRLLEVQALGLGGVGAEVGNGRAQAHQRVQHFLEVQAFPVIQRRLLNVAVVGQWRGGNAKDLPENLLSLLFCGLLALLQIVDHVLLRSLQLLLLVEAAAEAALQLLEVAGRLGDQTTG